jgi:hypothetical protein
MARRGRNPNLFIRLRIKDSIENRTREGGTQAPFIMGTRGAHSIRRWYNNPPFFNSFTVDENTGVIGSTFQFDISASDFDGDVLSYSWSISGSGSPSLSLSNANKRATFTAAARGDYTITVSVSDGIQTISQAKTVSVLNRAPTQNTFTINKTSGYVNDSFILTMVSNTDPDGDPVTITWSGISSDQISVENPSLISSVATVTPTSAGTFTITATVSDGAGGTYSNSETINVVANTIPTVSLSVTPTEGFIDTSFDVTSTITNLDPGKTLTYSWADNGGAMSSLPPSATGVSLSQAARGTHTVSVTVDDGYNTSTSTITYEVVNRIPSLGAITISPSTTGNQDTVFTASVTASNLDSDDVITYSWSFAGAPGGSSPVFVGTGNSVTFDPPDRIFGDYTLSVVASDQFGGTSSPSTATVTVENRAPTISSFTVDSASGYITDQFTFDVVASDPDGSALTYVWDSNVLSSTFTTSNGGRTATYRPRGTMITGGYKGDHVITVTVSDPDGGEVTSNALTVAIADRPPVASLTYSGTTNTGETITLDAAGSSDPDGDTVEYAWSFVSKPSSSTATFTTAAATATFPADVAGDYTVRLTVTSGTPPMSDSEDVTITITTLTSYPTVTITPTAYPDPGDGSFVPEWPMEIAGSAEDSLGNPVTSGVTWNWSLSGPVGHTCFLDDGTGDNGSSFSSAANLVSFIFDNTTTGTYTVSLYASTATETGDTETYTFTVNTLPPSGP